MRAVTEQFFSEYVAAHDRETEQVNKAYSVLVNTTNTMALYVDEGNGLTALQAKEIFQWLEEYEAISGDSGSMPGGSREEAFARFFQSFIGLTQTNNFFSVKALN